ncbi:disease resistance protein Pik-2-like [Triticum urartu]|uniref:Disease resistance protein RPM1 n=1 Tax=Triticum urartu TaxID=4572 RepID=A0A8R7TF30_TRIUA|nr:disease resistance protein Pik-2-like [Triticum urartu]
MEHPVVSAGGGAINILLCKLGAVLIQEAQLLGGIRGELEYMKDELESMTAFLQDLAEEGNRRKQVKVWMKQVREVAYDVEDCVDEFTYHLGSTTSGSGLAGLFHRCIRFMQTVRVRRQIAKQIQQLKARATSISDRNSRYGGNHLISGAEGNTLAAQPAPSYITSLDIRTPALFPEITELVGIEARQSNLVNWLVDENVQQLLVLSIFGFGGLGKTTLAMTTYQTASASFQCRAFVTVSQKFDVKGLIRDILRQIIRPVNQNGPAPAVDPLKGMEEWNVGQLADMLRQHLEDKRYLIVLDDIWSMSAWEGIRFCLPNSHTGSRIIVTTRMKTVAQACCLHEYDRNYEIEQLNGSESSELFFKRIFGNRENCPAAFINISERILGKCGGIPLAIVSIAGLLASTPLYSYDRWEKIYNSLGLELETSPWLEKLKKILELSYDDLPYHLKTCFLYLSTYPEDYKIRRKSLLRRWIAERFVTEKRGLSALEVSEKYFNELLNRSMVLPIEMSFDGKVKTFRVHDIMLEIIVSKSIEENFVTLVGQQSTLAPQEKIRRLSIHGGSNKNIATSKLLSHVRSLSIFADGEMLQFAWIKLLRILDLEGSGFARNGDIRNICKLFQLEYLSLWSTYVTELPVQIGNLKKLETLDVRDTAIKHLPPHITNLPNLSNLLGGRRVYNYSGLFPISNFWGMHIPNKLGNLEMLTTLAEIEITDSTSCYISELGKLSQLRKLGVMMFVDDDMNWMSLITAIAKLSSCLQSLLIWRPDGVMNFRILDTLSRPPMFLKSINFRGKLGRLPEWIGLLDNLTELTLRATELESEEHLKVTSQLPSLLYLRLHHSAYTGRALTFSASEFPSLKLLTIHLAVYQALNLRFEEGTAPKLHRLELSFFENASIRQPSGINFLANLQEVLVHADPCHNSEAMVHYLRNEARRNPNQPTVTFKAKQWKSARTGPAIDYRGNIWF